MTHLFAEDFECRLQLVSQLALGLLRAQVVAVVQVLSLAQIRRRLADLGVKLHVDVLLLTHQDGVLETSISHCSIVRHGLIT